ncbi:MAG: glycoside hydrolase family 38 C-terminal domain-containing protein [Fimbriimonas sp.]|nr:glycoside hydrolase family 38 C-terminal domain-containing protein [Fimbriimonas sp.]
MHKHTELTRNRIHAFLRNELKPRLYGDRRPLKIEINSRPCETQFEAKEGPWTEVAHGYEYGPAYTTFWFRLSGIMPQEFAGAPVAVVAEVGGERTVWKDNSPWCGVDVEHSDFGWLEGSAMSNGGTLPQGGEPVEFYIQCYTRNAQTTVHGKEQPRSQVTERVDRAELVVIDTDTKDLYYDVDFTLNLLESIDDKDPAYATMLRALNDVANTYSATSRDSISRCRKIVRDALGSLNGEFKHTIFPVGHAHLDTAWLWPLHITHKKMAHTTATQLGLMERYPEYVFAHSQASQYEWIEKEYPVLFERVKEAIGRGQWEPVGSMWVEADCNLTGAESLIRQFLYGRRYFREKLGYNTEDMWLPDVFGYAAALPQILAKFNIKYFMTQKISWNQFNKFPHHTFWWQGIDGTRIWSHFPPADTYNGSAEPKEVIYSVKNYKDQGRSDQSLYLFGFGDGGGGPTERHLEFLRRGRMAPNYPDVVSGKRAQEFFREAKARSRDLMTWVGELYLELHRGTYTSQAANKKGNRVSEFLLRDAELLACFSPGFPADYPATELEAAWKLVLLNQFHDIIPGSSVHEVYEDSRADYEKIAEVGNRIVAESLHKIASGFDTSSMKNPVALFHNATMVTQGSIPWDEEPAPTSIVTTEESLPVQLVDDFGEKKLILPIPQTALGTVVVAELSEAAPASKYRLKSSNRRIENEDLIVRFDLHGNLTSIQSLEDQTEFLEAGKLGNVFQLFEDKPNFWSAWDVDAFALETGQDLVRSESFDIVERGPVRVAALVVKRFGKSTIRQKISLGPTPGVRFDTEIDWREEDKMLKVAFPVNVNAARATYEIQFGNVERPTHGNTTWDMAKFEVCAQKWVDLCEGDQGVALINDCKYGHDVKGNVMRLTLLRSPKAPDPLCDMGVHRFSYSLVPHYGPYNYAGIVQAAYSFNAPLRSVRLDSNKGVTGSLPALVACEDRNVMTESVKKAEDSDDIVVRLYECHNSRGKAELYCAKPAKAAMLCDLEENEIDELTLQDGVVSFEYKPFEIITIKLKM